MENSLYMRFLTIMGSLVGLVHFWKTALYDVTKGNYTSLVPLPGW